MDRPGSSIGMDTKRIVGLKGQKEQYWDGQDRKSSIDMDREQYWDRYKENSKMDRIERVVLGWKGWKEQYWDRQDRKSIIGIYEMARLEKIMLVIYKTSGDL